MRLPLKWIFRAAIAMSLSIAYINRETGIGNETIYQARSFYSAYAVREDNEHGPVRRLVAGTHVHGVQHLTEALERTPISYYHERTGIAHLFKKIRPRSVGAIGLGIGSIVAFGGKGDTFDLYELDPLVIDIANEYFTVLPESQATLNYFTGDGRLQMRGAADGSYDLLVLDAFTSGSIPTHLVTLEAMQEFFTKIKPDGAIAFHISNHYIDLLPVLNAVANELETTILYHESSGNEKEYLYPAVWVVLTYNKNLASELVHEDRTWLPPTGEPVLWHDEYSNIFSILK